MPEEFNGKLGVKDAELVALYGTIHNLKQAKKRHKQNFVKLRWGGNGRYALTDFDCLPIEIQHAIGDPRLVKHVFEKYYRTDADARRFFTQHKLENGQYLATELQDRYIVNASVLKAALGFKAEIEKQRKGLNTRGIDEVLLNHTVTFQQTLKIKHRVEHTLPGSLKRFKEVLKAFEKKGYTSLISGKIGNGNSRKMDDKIISLLKSLFVSDPSKPSPTDIYRLYLDFLAGKKEVFNNDTGERIMPEDFKQVSDTTIRKYLTSWDVAVGTSLKRQPHHKQIGQFKPSAGLDRPKFAGSIMTTDDRNPAFIMLNGKRVWLYIAFDVASEAVVAIVHGDTKEGIIIELYRQLVRNIAELGFGMFDGLECESSLNSQYKDTFLAEGALFQNVRIEANNPRGKIAENFNGRARYQKEKQHPNATSRPFAKRESNQGGTHQPQRMHYNDIVQLCLQNYEDWNNDPHYKVDGLSKWEYYTQNQHPDLKPINYHAILPHMGYKTATSCNVGMIRLNHGEYWLGENGEIALGDKLINLMKQVEGRDVIVYWLDGNDAKTLKALVFIGDRLICEAIVKPTFPRAVIERKPEHEPIMKLVFAYIKTVEQYGRRSKNEIERVTVINNTPKPERKFKMPGLKYDDPADIQSGGLLPEPMEDLDYIPEIPEKSLLNTF